MKIKGIKDTVSVMKKNISGLSVNVYYDKAKNEVWCKLETCTNYTVMMGM